MDGYRVHIYSLSMYFTLEEQHLENEVKKTDGVKIAVRNDACYFQKFCVVGIEYILCFSLVYYF